MESETRPSAFRKGVISWSNQSERSFSWRPDPSPYEVLIAEVLLQRTFAEKVQPIFDELIEEYPGPEKLARANLEDLVTLIKPLGLQQKKAGALVKIADQIQSEGMPENEAGLMELPYVGLYGANSVLCFGFGERRSIVDANVIRIFNRVFDRDFEDDRDDQAWELATEVLPKENVQDYNLGLLDLGAEICTPNSPHCETCPVKSQCNYFNKEVNS